MRIEAFGNTKEEAESDLARKRADLAAQTNARFGKVDSYGNFEVGYKLVQEYEPGI